MVGRSAHRVATSRLRRCGNTSSLHRPALKVLPVSRYEFARYHEARVNIDYHIAIDEHFYSVPQALVHRKVEARATARSIEVLHRGERVNGSPPMPAPMSSVRLRRYSRPAYFRQYAVAFGSLSR